MLRRSAAVILPPVVVLVSICTVWELWVRLANVSRFTLPPPSTVAAGLGDIDQMWPDLRTTIVRVLVGFALAAAIGLLLAVVIVSVPPVGRAIYPLLVWSQVLPKLAVAPLFLVWFGFGGVSTVLIVFLIAFFPVVINAALGFRSVDVEQLYLARSMGAGWFQTFLRIRVPSASPGIFGGLKLAALLSVTGAIVAEFISATSGIGRVIQTASGDLDLARIFVAVTYVSTFGLLSFVAIEVAERLAIPWHVSQRDRFEAAARDAS